MPRDQIVVDAVRAWAALPFVFEPSRLRYGSGDTSVLLDGGVVADSKEGWGKASPAAPQQCWGRRA